MDYYVKYESTGEICGPFDRDTAEHMVSRIDGLIFSEDMFEHTILNNIKSSKLYRGLTYPWIFQFGPIRYFWRKFCCPRHCHLFDEVISDRHYFVCDACNFKVGIDDSFSQED